MVLLIYVLAVHSFLEPFLVKNLCNIISVIFLSGVNGLAINSKS
jgi:hypothetical protein